MLSNYKCKSHCYIKTQDSFTIRHMLHTRKLSIDNIRIEALHMSFARVITVVSQDILTPTSRGSLQDSAHRRSWSGG